MIDWLKSILAVVVGLVGALFVIPIGIAKDFFLAPSSVPIVGKVLLFFLVIAFWYFVYST